MSQSSLKRLLIWGHNGLHGANGMIRSNADRIAKYPTITRRSKEIAEQIYDLTFELHSELNKRNDNVQGN